jgi:hypothetical protein
MRLIDSASPSSSSRMIFGAWGGTNSPRVIRSALSERILMRDWMRRAKVNDKRTPTRIAVPSTTIPTKVVLATNSSMSSP